MLIKNMCGFPLPSLACVWILSPKDFVVQIHSSSKPLNFAHHPLYLNFLTVKTHAVMVC